MTPSRLRSSARLALAAALVLVAVPAALGLLVAIRPPAAAQDAQGPWRPVIEGLWGDNVKDLAFVGNPDLNFRGYVMVSADFGLSRSTDGAETWRRLRPNPARPQQIAHAVARDRAREDGQRVYAGLQNLPLMARSEDGGRTWSLLGGPDGPSRIDLLETSTGGRVYAGTAGAPDLFSSTDLGETWQPHAGIIGPLDPVNQLVAAPDEAVLYLRSAGRVYRSLDDPDDWTQVLGPSTPTTSLQTERLAAGPRGRLIAAGTQAGQDRVLVSEDRGATWRSTIWPGQGDAELTAVGVGEISFGVTGFWAGYDDGRVLRSINGGQTWTEELVLPLPPTLFAIDGASYEVFVGSDGLGLFRVDPVLHTGAVPAEILSVAAPSLYQDDRALLLAQVRPALDDPLGVQPPIKLLFDSEDRGESWSRALMTDEVGLGDELLPSSDYDDDGRLFSGPWRSTDEGRTWEAVGALPGPGARRPYVVAVGPVSATHPVLYGLETPYADGVGGTGLYYSPDAGDTWELAESTVGGIVEVVVSPGFETDSTAFFATDRGAVFATDDARTFSEISRVTLIAGQGAVHDFAISPDFVQDKTLFLIVENNASPQRPNVYVSNSRGQTWQPRQLGIDPEARPAAVVLSPAFMLDRGVFFGTGRDVNDPLWPAIYASDNAGVDWFAELLLEPEEIRAFTWAGSWAEGRVFAAIGRAGLWLRELDGSPAGPVLVTPSATPSPSATASPSSSATATQALTATATVGPSPTATATGTPDGTPDATATGTPPTATPSVSPTGTPDGTPSAPATATGTGTPPTPTTSPTPDTPGPSPSASPEATPTATPTIDDIFFGRIFLPMALTRRSSS